MKIKFLIISLTIIIVITFFVLFYFRFSSLYYFDHSNIDNTSDLVLSESILKENKIKYSLNKNFLINKIITINKNIFDNTTDISFLIDYHALYLCVDITYDLFFIKSDERLKLYKNLKSNNI